MSATYGPAHQPGFRGWRSLGANWWPAALGVPSSVGAQNDVRYAYFPAARRLAVDLKGKVTVYDTQDHQIGGFSQQQSELGSLSFASQFGPVEVSRLPVVSGADEARSPSEPTDKAAAQPNAAAGGGSRQQDILAAIERLGELQARGILMDAEFSAKKTELLSRLWTNGRRGGLAVDCSKLPPSTVCSPSPSTSLCRESLARSARTFIPLPALEFEPVVACRSFVDEKDSDFGRCIYGAGVALGC